jgi:DNA-damage-inducible protein D
MANIQLFENHQVRSTFFEGMWYFVVEDVVRVLTDSINPKDYIKKLKKRDPELGKGWGQFVPTLSVETPGGKQRMSCANVKGMLRIIQSVPSPKAEPFKLWLAKVGQERLEEIENPELAQHRMREIYKAKGYSDEWIEKRVRGITVRDELTNEWKKRGVKEGLEYAILTSEISKATFGLTPSDYKKFKGLTKPQENLRDHMTDLELIFTMLGEASTTEIAKTKDAHGFDPNKRAAIEGGTVAGNARRDLEKKSGRKVVTKENYKALTEKQIRQLKRGKKQ